MSKDHSGYTKHSILFTEIIHSDNSKQKLLKIIVGCSRVLYLNKTTKKDFLIDIFPPQNDVFCNRYRFLRQLIAARFLT